MKIRNGYVSNSSSSSFLVVYKNIDEFSRFEKFNGYSEFMDDLNQKRNTDVTMFISSSAASYFYDLTNCFKSDFQIIIDSCNTYSPWDILKIVSRKTGIIVEKKLADTEKIVGRIASRREELKDGSSNKKWEIEEILRKEFKTEFNEIVDRISKEIEKVLLESHNNFCIVEYEDDSDRGDYMEHQFMPFIASSPDDDFVVISKSNH